ncbi:MAG: DUF4384 domain-containing protein [Gemmatimonadales bacterium]|nr:DUF4384 domain-containing protein [Gemmatimonadales bacterium]
MSVVRRTLFPIAVIALTAPLVAPAAAQEQAPRPIRLELNDNGRFEVGDRAKVAVTPVDDGYLLVVVAHPDGRVRVLFPRDPGDDAFVRGGRELRIAPRDGKYAFDLVGETGGGAVLAAIAAQPLRTEAFTVNGRWDLAELGRADSTGGGADARLLALADRLVGDRFGYDLREFSVGERAVSAGPYVGLGMGPAWGWGPGWGGWGGGWGGWGWAWGPRVVVTPRVGVIRGGRRGRW